MTVSGAQNFPADQILAASGLKTGEVVTAPQIQAAADRLAALGIFLSVNYRYASKDDSISIEFQVKQAPTYPLSFDNFPWFTDAALGDAIRAQIGLFTGVAPGGGTMIDEITGVLEKLLASRNVRGKVTHQLIEQADGDGRMMQFRVDGPALLVQSVRFGDSLATNSEQLKDRISDIQGHPYSRFAAEIFENEHVRPTYAAGGFLHAQIGPPEPHLTANAADPNDAGVDLLIPVTPGPRYTWKGAAWQGNTVFTSAVLNGTLAMKPGDVANGMKIEAEWQRIQSEYARHGYLDVKITPQPQYDDVAHQVFYRVNIEEGPQYRMGKMVITGLSLDAGNRLRKQWLTAPGQVFDKGYYEHMLQELAKPSRDVFGEMPIHYTEFGHWLRPNTSQHTVDVLLDFK